MNKLERLEEIQKDIDYIKLSQKNPSTWVKVFELINKGEAGFNEEEVKQHYKEWLTQEEEELNEFIDNWNKGLSDFIVMENSKPALKMTNEQILNWLKND